MKLIAELCQNHNGSFENVKRMVDQAAAAGATHVKIQTIYARNLTFRPQFETGLEQDDRTLSIKRPWKPEYERLKSLELTHEQGAEFVEYCNRADIIPVTTCFARGDAAEIRDQGFRTVKVASYDCASYPLLRELASNFDALIVSTGATFDDEIAHAASVLQQLSADYSFLHCVTIYPTPLEKMNLARMAWLRQFAPDVGFSDHSLVERDGIAASKAAIALGAGIVERHFTILGHKDSKDGPVSITPAQLKMLADFAAITKEEQFALMDREHSGWEVMKGFAQRELSDTELLNRDYYRGRFATPRQGRDQRNATMIFNWEETPV